MGDFFKPCPSKAKAGFKNSQVDEKWVSVDVPIYAKVSYKRIHLAIGYMTPAQKTAELKKVA
ncbi:hypothetical protein BSPWISOXPB_10112 [uncultured Gammaproteobacteria bacterium]|nr:hypothetical protein BSPWISOXPB_10112 [uncultured Gammaproteobacteria bacterium]